MVLGLAAWRVSYLLHAEAGPWGVVRWVRSRFGIEHDEFGDVTSYSSGSVFACIGCLSLWVALGLVLLPSIVSLVLAVSAVAILTHLLWKRLSWDG